MRRFSHPGIIERARSAITPQRYAITEGGGTPPPSGVRSSVLGIFPAARPLPRHGALEFQTANAFATARGNRPGPDASTYLLGDTMTDSNTPNCNPEFGHHPSFHSSLAPGQF